MVERPHGDSPPSAAARIAAAGDRIARSAAFAYGSLILIQAKVVWGMWQFKDLTSGDEQGYFEYAARWASNLEIHPVWSPLYQAYFGTLKWVLPGAYEVTIAHRLLIVFAATALVLAIFRRLLTPGLAWLLAVWWAVLPINFDTVYEVHLFAILPILGAVLLALSRTGFAARTAVFSIFLATAVLMRNEQIVTVAIWCIGWIGYELQLRRSKSGQSVRRLVTAVATPVAIVAAIAILTVLSYPGPPERRSLSNSSSSKHRDNVCQIYAFGYQQRHDDFTGSPWTDCGTLMARDFEQPKPTLLEAIKANPGAMSEHFAWNARLVPYGLQLALFNATSGSADNTPDYFEVTTGSMLTLIGLLAVVIVLVVGGALIWPERRRWEDWFRERAWGWLALGAAAATTAGVMIMQRPRPSYMFDLTIFLLALIGVCAMAIVMRWPALGRMRPLIPVVALVLVVALPPYYDSDYVARFSDSGRPLKRMVERLEPFREALLAPGVRLLGTRAAEACAYLSDPDPCKGQSVVIAQLPRGDELLRTLERDGIDYIYADEIDLSNPSARAELSALAKRGWTPAAPDPAVNPSWLLLERT